MSTREDQIGEEEATVQQIASGEATQPSSIIEGLRRKRQELEENREVDIPVPGYDQSPPVLLIRYTLLDGPEIERITRKVFREVKDRWSRTMLSTIDAMVEACVGFYVDNQDGSVPQPLTFEGSPIINFGPELATALGYEASTARQNVRELFGNNDVALAQHNIQLSRWMGNTAIEVDEELFGGNP